MDLERVLIRVPLGVYQGSIDFGFRASGFGVLGFRVPLCAPDPNRYGL